MTPRGPLLIEQNTGLRRRPTFVVGFTVPSGSPLIHLANVRALTIVISHLMPVSSCRSARTRHRCSTGVTVNFFGRISFLTFRYWTCQDSSCRVAHASRYISG